MAKKSITVKFSPGKAPEVFTQKPNRALVPVDTGTELKKFTLGVLGNATAEMSIQVSPWVREYPAPIIWHLNQAWSLGKGGMSNQDILDSKPLGTTSVGELTFEYDKAAQTIDWTNGTATGQVILDGSAPGWYLILKQDDSTTKTAGITVKGNVVVKH